MFATLDGHDRKRIAEVLEIVDLTDRADDKARHYSLGMQQRLGIAVALLPDPDLLVLDEPTNGLDPVGIVEIRSLLMRLGASGKTVFVSSHLMAEIQAACDWVVMIDGGRVVFSGTLPELLARSTPSIKAAAEDTDSMDRLLSLVSEAGYAAALVNGGVEIEAPAEWAPDLNRLASGAGITLRELRPTVADLERTFFAMTGTRKDMCDACIPI